VADDYLQVTDGSGTKVQTFSNTVNGVAGVETQAVALVDNTGANAVAVKAASTAAAGADKALVVALSPNNGAKVTDGTNTAAVKAASTAAAAADPALVVAVSPNNGVSLGTSVGKTNVMKTGTLASSATTADQVILTYTVTSGKTFYLEYLDFWARLTTFAATATLFGAVSLETPSGTKVYTMEVAHAGNNGNYLVQFPEPIPVAAGVVIRVVCTPAAATAFTWRANFGGYEK
jgi:hypothetical protein